MKEIIKQLLTFKNTLKMFHWRTKIYNQHKITNELGDKIDSLIDKFVEVLIGSRKKRPEFSLNLSLKEIGDDKLEGFLEDFREWLTNKLLTFLADYETDLMNIKDEMLAEINQTLYLVRME